MFLHIVLVRCRQVQKHPKRDVLREGALRLDKENEFVTDLKAQVIVQAVGQHILQRDQFHIGVLDRRILRMKRLVQLHCVLRFTKQKREDAVLDGALWLSHWYSPPFCS